MKLLKQREKEEDKIKREEEKMRAKVAIGCTCVEKTVIAIRCYLTQLLLQQVDKLAQKMLQQVANTRRSQPEVPLTQVAAESSSRDPALRSPRAIRFLFSLPLPAMVSRRIARDLSAHAQRGSLVPVRHGRG